MFFIYDDPLIYLFRSDKTNVTENDLKYRIDLNSNKGQGVWNSVITTYGYINK